MTEPIDTKHLRSLWRNGTDELFHSMRAAADEIDRLRARLAAVEPEWDLSPGRWALVRDGEVIATAGPRSHNLGPGWVRVEDLPAEAAGCPFWDGQHGYSDGVCEDCGRPAPDNPFGNAYSTDVLAAARGEGDRG